MMKTRHHKLISFALIITSYLTSNSCLNQSDKVSSEVSDSSAKENEIQNQKIISAPTADERKNAAKLRQSALQYRQQGNYTKAIESLEKSVNLDRENMSSLVLLGWTLHLAQKPQPAQEILEQALTIDSQHIQTLNALGIVYLVGGNLEQAIATHTQAVTISPNNKIAHYNLNLAYQRLQQYTKAINHGKQAITLEPYNPHPWVALAITYWEMGEPQKSQENYRKAINLDGRYRQVSFLSHLKEAGFSGKQIKQTQEVLEATF